jgi:hypothetical protein
MLRRVVGVRARDPDTVHDLVQEALARVIAVRGRLDDGAVAPYAIVTARNLVTPCPGGGPEPAPPAPPGRPARARAAARPTTSRSPTTTSPWSPDGHGRGAQLALEHRSSIRT